MIDKLLENLDPEIKKNLREILENKILDEIWNQGLKFKDDYKKLKDEMSNYSYYNRPKSLSNELSDFSKRVNNSICSNTDKIDGIYIWANTPIIDCMCYEDFKTQMWFRNEGKTKDVTIKKGFRDNSFCFSGHFHTNNVNGKKEPFFNNLLKFYNSFGKFPKITKDDLIGYLEWMIDLVKKEHIGNKRSYVTIHNPSGSVFKQIWIKKIEVTNKNTSAETITITYDWKFERHPNIKKDSTKKIKYDSTSETSLLTAVTELDTFLLMKAYNSGPMWDKFTEGLKPDYVEGDRWIYFNYEADAIVNGTMSMNPKPGDYDKYKNIIEKRFLSGGLEKEEREAINFFIRNYNGIK